VNAIARGVLASVAMVGAAGCDPPMVPSEDYGSPLPLCVGGLSVGQTLSVQLVAIYDAQSDYVFDPTFLRSVGFGSCDGVDGLGIGSVVSLTPSTELSAGNVAGWSSTCAPLGLFEPPSLQDDDDLTTATLWTGQDITIAGEFEDTTYQGVPAHLIVGLYTPSKNYLGTLATRALPPLVLSREIDSDSYTAGCADNWVVTWDPTP
jgi:hypothetical protein